jgi:hypothetical protein
MMNRQQLTSDTIQFEDFAACAPQVGEFLEVPMNAFGSVVARFQVKAVNADPSRASRIVAQAVKVS